jgi:hypothetical protein
MKMQYQELSIKKDYKNIIRINYIKVVFLVGQIKIIIKI